MKSIEDGLRSTIADMQAVQNKLEAQLNNARSEAEQWQAKYIDSGKWRKYLPTAIVAALVGFGIGLLL